MVAYLTFRRGNKADDKAQENILASNYGSLVESLQNELKRSQEQADEERDRKLLGVVNLAQAKADQEYVKSLEDSLDRARGRIDTVELRLEKADKKLEDCRKDMDLKIKALEERLKL